MNLVCYNNNSPKNKVVKDLTTLSTLTGTLREGSNMISPTVLIESATPPLFNYCYIQDFYRYYFVDNITNVNKSLWSISLHCDVLVSFWDSIKTSSCIVSRNELKRVDGLIDNEIWTTSDSLYSVQKFPNSPFDVQTGTDIRYVLILAGAGTSGTTNDTVTWNATQVDGAYPLEIYNTYYIEAGSTSRVGVGFDYSSTNIVKFYNVPTTATLYFTAAYPSTNKNYSATYDGTAWVFNEVT